MSDRKGINTDERRAKLLIQERFPNIDPSIFEQKWQHFLQEKPRYDKPQTIADEFIKRWGEL